MELYETEEQQVEALKKWWQDNGTSTIAGLVFGILIILGWNYWQDHKREQTGKASDLYAELVKAVTSNESAKVDKLAEQVRSEYKDTDYATYSGLLQAKVKVDQGDVAGARKILETVAISSNKELSNIAKIRLVRLMMANKEYEQGLQLINSIDPASAASFSNQYDELVGDLYVALNRVDQARSSYQKALDNGLRSPLLQLKIDDLTAPEKTESKP